MRPQVVIKELPEKVLLDIFRCFLDDSPQLWPRLVQICRRWLRIVFAYGTPASKTRDSVPLIFPSSFGRGPCLRNLHPTRIAFPALHPFFHSFKNLVDLQLHEVLDPRPISPKAITNALSSMTLLQSLSLHFPSIAKYISPHTSFRTRIILPVLTCFKFRGSSHYLEGVVARIDAPRLEDIQITFVNEIITDLSALRSFIDQIDIPKSYRRAHIQLSARDISISLTRPGTPTCLRFQLLGELSAQKLSFMSRLCFHSSACLCNVEDLHVNTATPQDLQVIFNQVFNSSTGKWLDVIKSFPGVKWVHVEGSLSMGIVRGLVLLNRQPNVLPALHKLQIWPPAPRNWHTPLREAVVSFITARRLSGRPIAVEYKPISCSIDEHRRTGTMYAQCHYHYMLTPVAY